ncbi:O-methyltransferase [Pasteuria penetrans]|uniref:O-methyltransferase n=1 Tax=Pasteuria penetrans TaxID=86005 RepID=UPI000FB532B7|nr:O-methyltransferase [Pasteuria penetrans]
MSDRVGYVRSLFAREDVGLQGIRVGLKAAGIPDTSVPPEVGKFLFLLVRMMQPQRVLELGTLGGYSTLWMARALPPGGHIWSVDKIGVRIDLARRAMDVAGLSDRVTFCKAMAGEYMERCLRENLSFEFFFIDADKGSHLHYMEMAYRLGCPGALVIVDNLLSKGVLCQGGGQRLFARSIRSFNQSVATDDRWDGMILPFADGIGMFHLRTIGG